MFISFPCLQQKYLFFHNIASSPFSTSAFLWLVIIPAKQSSLRDSLFYQLDAQILYFNTFITFLYMFRALLCSSSGGQIVLVQHLVSSLFGWLFSTQVTRGLFSIQAMRGLFSTQATRGLLRTVQYTGYEKNVQNTGYMRTVQYTGYERILVTCVLKSHLRIVTIPYAVIIQLSYWRWAQ